MPSTNYATGEINDLVEVLGCTAGSSTAHHMAVIGDATKHQLAVTVRGNCALTGNLVTLTNVATGILVDYSATTGAASFGGTSITGTMISGTGVVVC